MKAIVFPGQGSQYIGMGKTLYEKYSFAKKNFDDVHDCLGYDIKDIIFEGDKETLNQTEYAQPALLLISYLMYISYLKENDVDKKMFSFVAGHSLGEYTALVFAEVLTFFDALKLVSLRGQLMQKIKNGSMAAVLGGDLDVIQSCLPSDLSCVLANNNAPGQVVLSGLKERVVEVCEILKEKGIKKTILLPVSGAFHSPYMKTASDEFSQHLNDIEFQNSLIPIVMNVSAKAYVDAGDIKQQLLLQMCSQVQWYPSVQFMLSSGVSEFIEVGPGKVLTGLGKRIAPDAIHVSYDQ